MLKHPRFLKPEIIKNIKMSNGLRVMKYGAKSERGQADENFDRFQFIILSRFKNLDQK